jgi:hypothetical protein
LKVEFAFPEEPGQLAETFADLLDPGDDERHQPRREPPMGEVSLDRRAKPEA